MDELHRFVAEHGHAHVPRRWFSPSGFNLGNWVDRHRRYRRGGTMPQSHVDDLEAVPGWVWNPRDSWDVGFSALLAFAAEHGHTRVPQTWVTPSEFGLGAWAETRRREYRAGTLAPQRIAALESRPRWTWNPGESAWQDTLDELSDFADTFGHTCVPAKWATPSGFRLGNRVRYLRHKYANGTLPSDRVDQLERFPSWTWDLEDAWWPAGYAELLRHVATHKPVNVPRGWRSDSGFALGWWVHKNRQDHRCGALSPERITELEALPEWSWGGHDDRWRAGLAELDAYIAEHGVARPPDRWVAASGFKLGNWVRTRRVDYRTGKLDAEKVAALSSLPGWTWGQSAA